ncbi:putative E3 ubiquitin-protein ligase HERC1-like protein, partial [Trifolium pratense]
EPGKLITWGSTDDLGQSYVTSGKHGETPEPFPLPNEVSIVKAAAAWAHCVAATDCGEVYTWGWKECIPSGKVFGETLSGISAPPWRWSKLIQVSPRSKVSKSTGGTVSGGEISTKRRKVSSAKQAAETSSSGDDILTAMPCLVTLNPGVRITSVAAGGRHTLVLSGID